MKKIYTLISLAVFFAFNGFAQTTLTLQPDSSTGKDAFISNWPTDGSENKNFGSSPDVDAIAWTDGGVFYITRGLLQFDLSALPPGAVITSATLTLYNNPTSTEYSEDSHLSGSNAAWLQRITTPWVQNAVTWNTQPSTTTLNEATLPQDTAINETYTVDVTTLAQDMINNPSSGFGFMLSLQTEQNYRSLVFASCYHPDSTLHPKLVITYITGCTSLVLQPDSTTGKNAFISNWPTDNSENTNFGHLSEFDAVAWTDGGVFFISRSLIQFDLSAVPTGATIASATLTLFNDPYSDQTNGMHSHLSGSNAAWLQRITTPWVQNTVTWNTQPSTTTVNEIALPQDTNPSENYTMDVTSFIQNMADSPSTNYGFMLELQTEIQYRSLIFASCYHPDSTLHPLLDICYTVAAAPPVASFQTTDSSICANACISFTDLSTNATSWQWSFHGGQPPSSTDQNPQSVCYLTSGSYDVTLVASNAAGSDTMTISKYIVVATAPPTPLITQSNDTLFCSTDTSYMGYQWYSDTVLIAGATDTFLVISQDGNYNVQVTNSNGCKIAVGINLILANHDYADNNVISLSPNPATDNLFISINRQSAAGEEKLIIFNLLGEAIYTKGLNSKQETINCKSFPAGIYFVQVSNDSSRWTGKFVKE